MYNRHFFMLLVSFVVRYRHCREKKEFMSCLIRIVVAALVLNFWLPVAYSSQDIVGCQKQCKKTVTWTGCDISKMGFMLELADTYGKQNNIQFALSDAGATRGVRDVVKGDVHLGGSCRLPLSRRNSATKEEKEGISLERDSLLIPMGWDALVVIVHKDNPASNISVNELKKILKGEITSWESLKDSNGKTGKFNFYTRTGKMSGVGRTLRQTIFDNTHEDFTQTAIYKESSSVIEMAIENDVNGIAVTGYSSAKKRAGLKALALNGHENSMKNLAAGKYPIYRVLLLTIMKESLKDPDIRDFILYAKSRDASKVIENAGTLPFSSGLGLARKLNENYLMEMFDLEEQGRYNPSEFDLKRWAAN
jgi:phosphate transport system substrate-binding protein